MSSVNKAVILGNLGKDPEIRTFQSGGRVCNMTIATSETWKDKKSGEKKEKTEWHRVVVFNENFINVCEKYLKKGSKVYIEGQIETRKYADKDGTDKYTTEIVLKQYGSELVMLDSPNKAQASTEKEKTEDVFIPSSDLGDEIPF